jgi:hypothetical protein
MDLVLRGRPVPPRVAFERIKRSLLSDDRRFEKENGEARFLLTARLSSGKQSDYSPSESVFGEIVPNKPSFSWVGPRRPAVK